MVKESKEDQNRALVVQSLIQKPVTLLQLFGVHGQVAPQHAVRAGKQEQELVLTIQQVPLMSQELIKKVAQLPQLIGGTGQVAPEHATVVLEQELEHVLIIQKVQPMSQKLSRKLATFNNAATTLGQHGVHGIHALIVGPFHLNDAVRDVNSSKHQRVPTRVKRYNTNIKRKIVKTQKITICQEITLMPRNPGEIYFTRFMDQTTMVMQKLNVNLMGHFWHFQDPKPKMIS